MIELLLVSPQTEQSNGGIAVWTNAFLQYASEYGISCNLLNIAMIGSRAERGNNKRNFIDEFVRTRAIFNNLKHLLKMKKYDIAHINTSCGTFGLIRDYITAFKIKKAQPNCKILVHIHCDASKQAGFGYKKKFLEKLLSLADILLVLNENNKKFLLEAFSVKSTVMPNFIDKKLVRDTEKVIFEEIKKAIFVGFIQPQKGAKEIFKLAEALPDITFELIGEVRADVQKWEKPANLILLGRKNRNEIIDALDEADVFIFPTYSEGFSIALLESMARGLPVITTDAGANAEMIEDKGGIIVPIGNIESLIKALDILNDTNIRKNMSEHNIFKVRKFYTSDMVVKQMSALYSDIKEKKL